MNKKHRTLLFIGLVLIIAFVVFQTLNKGGAEDSSSSVANAGADLGDLLDERVGKGMPAVLIFTYDADCCTATREYFDKHRSVMEKLEQKYSAHVNFLWIDVALYSGKNKEELISIASQYQVGNIPAVVMLDAKGAAMTPVLGEIDEKSVEGMLEGLMEKF